MGIDLEQLFLNVSYLSGPVSLVMLGTLSAGAVALSRIDFFTYTIPDKLLALTGGLSLVVYLVCLQVAPRGHDLRGIGFHAIQVVFILLILWVFWTLNARGFGYGDLKLLTLFGAFIPLPAWALVVLLACILGIVLHFSAVFALFRAGYRDSNPPLPIPFAPCLCAALLVLVFAKTASYIIA